MQGREANRRCHNQTNQHYVPKALPSVTEQRPAKDMCVALSHAPQTVARAGAKSKREAPGPLHHEGQGTSTPQLYSRAGCRVRSPRRQGPGTANRRCTNSVGCAHVPVPSTIPRDPAAPSTGRLGPGNGQRPSVEDG